MHDGTRLLPLLADVLYLTTVTQIMGEQARYYLPLLPLLIVPAALLVDDAFCAGIPPLTAARIITITLALLLGRDFTRPLTLRMSERVAARTCFYTTPVLLPQPPARPATHRRVGEVGQVCGSSSLRVARGIF